MSQEFMNAVCPVNTVRHCISVNVEKCVAMKDYLINRFSFPHIALCHGCGKRSTADDSELCAVCAITKQAAAQLTHDQLVILLENLTYLAYPPEPLILAPYEKKR